MTLLFRVSFLARVPAGLLLCVGLLSTMPARAQQAEIDALAARLAAQIALSKGPRVKKVLVADFLLPIGNLTELGHVWADEFSRSLASAAKGFEVVDRDRLRAIYAEKKFSPTYVRDIDMARWLAELAGAQGILRGYIGPSRDVLTLSIVMLWTEGRGEPVQAEASLQRTKEWDTLLAKELVPVDGSALTAPPPLYKAGIDGVSFPHCRYCPPPDYTLEARRRRFQGTVVLRIIITPEGRATNIRIVKPAPYGMTEKAVGAVKGWRFEPARSRDGTPVPIDFVVEVTVRLM